MTVTTTRRLSPLAGKVLEYLQTKGNASPLEVTLDLGINSGSFTRRITELRSAGYPIEDQVKYHPVTHRRYKRYFLKLHS